MFTLALVPLGTSSLCVANNTRQQTVQTHLLTHNLGAHPGFIGKSSHLDSLQDRGKVTDQRDVHHTNVIGSDYDLHRIVNMFVHCLRLRQEEKRKKMTNNSQFLPFQLTILK